MSFEERALPNEPQKGFVDRDPIHNVWDQEEYFKKVKSSLKEGATLEHRQEIEATGKTLLNSKDPYQVKLGIHLLRLCIWGNQPLAQEWVESIAPNLLSHPHPRVRHSALWNVRSSVWQDDSLADQGLKYAQVGLLDDDPAVQRVAIWTHGDAVVNNPNLYVNGLNSINAFLNKNPKESNYLFALEEFFMPINGMFNDEETYRRTMQKMRQDNDGYPGVKGRCSNILGEEFSYTQEDREKVHQRLIGVTQKIPEVALVISEQYNEAINRFTDQFVNSQTFIDRMRRLWVIRDLSWMDEHVDKGVFQKLADSLQDTRDGDLIRTTSVVLADNILKAPDEIADEATATVKRFYESSDIDGSQIVVAQTLTPLRYSPRSRLKLAAILPDLHSQAANKSVSFTLSNLTL